MTTNHLRAACLHPPDDDALTVARLPDDFGDRCRADIRRVQEQEADHHLHLVERVIANGRETSGAHTEELLDHPARPPEDDGVGQEENADQIAGQTDDR